MPEAVPEHDVVRLFPEAFDVATRRTEESRGAQESATAVSGVVLSSFSPLAAEFGALFYPQTRGGNCCLSEPWIHARRCDTHSAPEPLGPVRLKPVGAEPAIPLPQR